MGCSPSKSAIRFISALGEERMKESDEGCLLIGHTDLISRTAEHEEHCKVLPPSEVLPDILDPRLVQKTVRIFLSSTFTDTRLDRNELMQEVFEPIRDLCQQRGVAFEVVDLRWGVRQESVDDHRVVNICMEEIKRCQEISLGIAFIALLGDKYGWRPLPSSVDSDEFESLLEHIDKLDRELVTTWYLRDDNAVPPCHLLQPISSQFPIHSTDRNELSKAWEEWGTIEKKIWNLLRTAAEKIGLEEENKHKYTVSVTQLEVESGVVSDPEANQRSVVIDRRFDNVNETDKEARNYVNLQEDGKKDPECIKLLSELKEDRIPLSLDIGRVLKFTDLRWHHEGLSKDEQLHRDYLREMCKRTKELLISRITEVLQSLQPTSPVMEEVTRHAIFCRDHTQSFQGRKDILQSIHKYLGIQDPMMPLVVYGESGVGKTSLMAKVVMEMQERNKDRKVAILYRFCGTTPDSSTGRALTESFCEQLKLVYDISDEVPEDYKGLCEIFPSFIGHASEQKPLCIVIDSLDQLTDADGARRFLEWLPRKLPAHVHMVLSTLPVEGGCLQRLKTFGLLSERFLEVTRLDVHDGPVILENWLQSVNRTLTPEQQAFVLDAFNRCPLPLYLHLLFNKCRSWSSYKNIADTILESDVIGMINSLYQALEKYHGQMLVGRVLGLLAAGTDGMNSEDILNILSCDEELLTDVLVWHEPPKRRLPPLLLARLKYDLGPFLVERGAYGVSLLALYHRQFVEVARERYLVEDRNKETQSNIADYFSGEYHKKYGQERDIPAQPHAYSSVALNLRKLDRLPEALLEARDFKRLRSTLGDLKFIQAKCMAGMGYELLAEATRALSCAVNEQAEPHSQVVKDLEDILGFLRSEIHILSGSPILTYQQAATYPQNHWIARNALRMRLAFDQPDPDNIPTPDRWVEWLNKPEVPEAFELELGGHSKGILSTCFAKDNRTLLSGSADGTIRVWDSQTGELHAQLEDHQGPVTCVRLSPDGTIMASASADKTIRLWRFPAIKCLRILGGHEDRVTCVAFSKGGDKLLSSSKDKTLKIWDVVTGANLETLRGHKSFPMSCAWSPLDQSIAASCGDQLELFIWDLEEKKIRHTLEGHQRDDNPNFPVRDTLEGYAELDFKALIWSMCFSPDGLHLASACVDSDVILWDVQTGARVWTFNLPNDASTVAFVKTDHGTLLAAGSSAHHTVTVFDATFDEDSYDVSARSRTFALLGGHSNWVLDVAFNGDGTLLASAASDKTVRVWDATAAEKLREARFHSERCWSVAYSEDGKWLASASDDFKVCVWDMEALKVSLIYEGHENKRTFSCGVRACTFSRDSKQVASGGDELKIRIWSRESGKDNIVLHCGESMLPWCLRFSMDDKRLVSVGEFATGAIVWDLEKQSKITVLEGHERFCQYTEFSPSGKFILTSSIDNSARIWNSSSLEHVTTVVQPDWVTCATFSHNEKMLATCSKDELVRLWDTSTWKETCVMRGHDSEIRMVSFSPSDQFLASGALDQTIRIWDCDTGHQVQVFYAASGIWGLAWHPIVADMLTAGDAVGYLYFLKLHERKNGHDQED
ncbi:NACHT domain- and WD repeat-containing protein 1-like isoform X2 [Montipora capricornis]|uniref:NACHT domain- and WD repeat-containing protein 1-like isoform X2 n=1 Tax=Montipora capricornis TaxID=246305 RepID=UPI0035F1815D